MRVALLTREFPPEVYGGAGVHVEHLSLELARLVDLEVHCFGAPRPSPLVRSAYAFPDPSFPLSANTALQVMDVDLRMAAGIGDADIVHSHTWYTNLAGHLASSLHGIPHVMTVHSLEPLRPWKADQLGGGYAVSSFCEQSAIERADAIIAVSASMADDVRAAYPGADVSRLSVIHNGIDPEEYRPDERTDVLVRLGIDPSRPTVMWIGRVSPQKGVDHLLEMTRQLPAGVQCVFLAGASDTPEFGDAMAAQAAEVGAERRDLHWIETIHPRSDVVQLLSHASVFVCPSVYEPFGLINLEAMACGLPVVATAVGGIPEIVVDGVTGLLVPLHPGGAGLGEVLADRVMSILEDPARGKEMGASGRARVLEHFTWRSVAERTAALYSTLR